ncbi:chalcone isomerase family protein [Duganella hordei]|uniref:chalcone isomerase family protein n=1 Tax=Duganella hordei TaxID=2865934 RepID=UPI0030EAA19F
MGALLRTGVLALLPLLLAMAPARAAPAFVEAELGTARLAGRGAFTYFGLTIYTAELWVGPQGYRPAAREAAPYVLELRYARALDGHRIATASAEQMERTGAGTPAQRAAWLARMQSIFPDVQEGSRLAGVFLPGHGVRFYRDGKPLALVGDAAFAQAFFGIWLDPATTAPRLREALLRGAEPGP